MMRSVFATAILMAGLMTPAMAAQQQGAKSEEKAADSSERSSTKGRTRDTPFGRVRQDANPRPTPKPEKPSETGLVSAEVKGDTVTFRKRTPFGNQVWTRKRSELSEDERAILANSSASGKKNADAKAKPAPEPAAKPETSDAVAAKPE